MAFHPQTGEQVFWKVMPDGTAEGFEVTREVMAEIDRDAHGWFICIEGPILHRGVKATAFDLKVEQTYDAIHWFKTKEMKPAGMVSILKITAEWKG